MKKELIFLQSDELRTMKSIGRANFKSSRANCRQLDHVNIIRYYASFIDSNQLNIVLDLAEAGDMSRMIRVSNYWYPEIMKKAKK